jgi:hypothetical protein
VFVIPRPGYVRIVTEDPADRDRDTEVTLEMLQSAVDAALGRRVELCNARWLTRFGDAARQAATYVQGRVVLAGDAAHIHPPAGAIGVNVALDDAFNLGWKLAATVRGTAPPDLLGSYHTERHAAGAHVLANTRAQMLLGNAVDLPEVIVDLLGRVAAHPAGNRAVTEIITGLDTRYPMEPDSGHPWLGRLAPNLALTTDRGATDVASLLTAGRAVLIELTGQRSTAAGRVDVVSATCPEHPEIGAMLIRPDGHTAWLRLSDQDEDGLRAALERWHGPVFR